MLGERRGTAAPGRRIRLQPAATAWQQSAGPMRYSDAEAGSLLQGLARFNKALLDLVSPSPEPTQEEGRSTGFSSRPVLPGPQDEITDDEGNVEIPVVKAGEKTTLWRYQLPKSDPRYRPLQGRYELGIHFTE